MKKYFDEAYEIQRYLIDHITVKSNNRLTFEKYVELTTIQTEIIIAITDMLQGIEVKI